MTNFKKQTGAENRSVQDKLGPELTRALMTAPGKSLPDAVRTYERMTGAVVHNPLAERCDCGDCLRVRMDALYPQAALGD